MQLKRQRYHVFKQHLKCEKWKGYIQFIRKNNSKNRARKNYQCKHTVNSERLLQSVNLYAKTLTSSDRLQATYEITLFKPTWGNQSTTQFYFQFFSCYCGRSNISETIELETQFMSTFMHTLHPKSVEVL